MRGRGRDGARAGGRPAGALPRGQAWLLKMVPEAVVVRSSLEGLMAEPEMAAMLASTPRLVRAMRPLWWMLGIAEPGAPPPVQKPPAPPKRYIAEGTYFRDAVGRFVRAPRLQSLSDYYMERAAEERRKWRERLHRHLDFMSR